MQRIGWRRFTDEQNLGPTKEEPIEYYRRPIAAPLMVPLWGDARFRGGAFRHRPRLAKAYPAPYLSVNPAAVPRAGWEDAMQLKDQKLFRQQCYIDGEWVERRQRRTIPVTNPATGETLGTVPKMGAEETRRAIEAAERGAAGLARQDRQGARRRSCANWFDLMMANQDDLGALMTAEQGKPLAEAKGEIAYAASLHRMVRRGRQAHLRRHDPLARRRQAHRRASRSRSASAPRSRRGISRRR